MRPTVFIIGVLAAQLVTCSSQTASNVEQFLATVHSNDLAFLNTNITDYASNINAAYAAYQQGKVSKGAMMILIQRAANAQPHDFYGKIIDQHGHPISGADITGNLMVMRGLGDGAENKNLKAQSDADGLFQFTGIKGNQFGVVAKKGGYAMSVRKGPTGKTTGPNDRETFTMWKLQGEEPLIHFSFKARIPHDDTPVVFDLHTGKIVNAGGDLIIRLKSPLEPSSNQQYDWQATIQPVDGGIVSSDVRLESRLGAPDSGYDSEFDINYKKDVKPWSSTFHGGFYFKDHGGSDYGKFDVGIVIYAIKDGFVPITLDGYINPAGSRNLEIDPKLVTEAHP